MVFAPVNNADYNCKVVFDYLLAKIRRKVRTGKSYLFPEVADIAATPIP
jgi:hypothetical protein